MRSFSPHYVVDGRFELLDGLGAGSFGEVWRARDLETGEQVAIKLLHDWVLERKRSLQRFQQEAQLQLVLEHPSIARSIAWSVQGPDVYLALEFVDGETLSDRLVRHASSGVLLGLRQVTWLAERLASAITHAHERGVIHRDLKPKNLMLNRREQGVSFLKVIDFGIAKVLEGSTVDPTTIGTLLGSLLYLTPEQVRREPVDHRTDVFGMATIFFEALTLRRAWAVDRDGNPMLFHLRPMEVELNSQFGILGRIVNGERPSVAAFRPDVPATVDEILARAMAVDPRDRFESPKALCAALSSELHSEATHEMKYPSAPTAPLDDADQHRTERGAAQGEGLDTLPEG